MNRRDFLERMAIAGLVTVPFVRRVFPVVDVPWVRHQTYSYSRAVLEPPDSGVVWAAEMSYVPRLNQAVTYTIARYDCPFGEKPPPEITVDGVSLHLDGLLEIA